MKLAGTTNETQTQPDGLIGQELAFESRGPAGSAYSSSLLGEYARLLLLLLGLPLFGWFVFQVSQNGAPIVSLAGSGLLLGVLVLPFGNRVIRILLLTLMIVNVLAFALTPDEFVQNKANEPTKFPSAILVCLLLAATAFETAGWVRETSRASLVKVSIWSLIAIPALVYIIAIPLTASLLGPPESENPKLVLRDPNWRWWNDSAFRAAKFMVFLVFTYAGACIGSFLNVVAYCLPRGQSIALRDSQCPQCQAKIRRVDNLPIVSYLNLMGRCRNCHRQIPVRYLAVEIAAAAIFGSLFLFELIAGCSNVPNMSIFQKGILWTILYPNWTAIGIYFYHALFMCALLTLALVEWSGQLLKKWQVLIGGFLFSIPAVVFMWLQPVAFGEHLGVVSFEFEPWQEQISKLIVGALFGCVLGFVFRWFYSRNSAWMLIAAFALAGLVLGWQGLLQATILFLVLALIVFSVPPLRQRFDGRFAMVFLLAIFIHHPFWSSISKLW